MLNSRQSAMLESRLVQGSAISTRQCTFAFSVRAVCASRTSSSKCRSLLSQKISGLVGSGRLFRTGH